MIDKRQCLRGWCCPEFFELARMNSKKLMSRITTTGNAVVSGVTDFHFQLS